MIINWDQTGVKMVPTSCWTMNVVGATRVEVYGLSDKRMITLVLCGSAVGEFFPPQVIYKGKTSRCHPKTKFPSHWHVTQSPNHWLTEQTMIEYIENVILPYINGWRSQIEDESRSALVIMDNFKGQTTSAVNKLLEDNNIQVSLLPANTTDRLQPMDLSVNKHAKAFLKHKFQEWYREQIAKQLEGMSEKDIDNVELQPIDLKLGSLE